MANLSYSSDMVIIIKFLYLLLLILFHYMNFYIQLKVDDSYNHLKNLWEMCFGVMY